MQTIAILIPAAGASRRMQGDDKLLKQINGVALLRRQSLRALDCGAHVCVTVPDYDHPRVDALAGLAVQLVAVPDRDQGMSASLRRGIAGLPKTIEAVMILPADMPEITAADMKSLIDGFDREMHPTLQQATTQDGTPGHPVLFPADCFTALMQLTGDVGARAVVQANTHRLRHVPLDGQRALIDLDTPAAWTAWRAQQTEPC